MYRYCGQDDCGEQPKPADMPIDEAVAVLRSPLRDGLAFEAALRTAIRACQVMLVMQETRKRLSDMPVVVAVLDKLLARLEGRE